MKITTYLKRKKISIRTFAKLVGVSHTAISLYLKGERQPSRETLVRLKRVMNTNIVELK